MWIYEPSEAETDASLPTQKAENAEEIVSQPEAETEDRAVLPAQAATEPLPPMGDKIPEKVHARKSFHASWDCWLLAAAFLLGSGAAGVLQAVSDARQTEVLRYYLDAWCRLFSAGELQHAVCIFSTEYFTLGIAASLFLLLGLSALGPLLIFGGMMLYGLGSGLLLVQLFAAGGWRAALPTLLWTGIPAALAGGGLCLFAASALQVSSRIRAYSFWNRATGQGQSGVQALIGQYLLTMALLLPLCGVAAGLSYLGSRFG